MRIDVRVGRSYRLKSTKTIFSPATTAWVTKDDRVTIVGEWKENEELDPEHRIYMVEWASDSFTGSGYRFAVRASHLTD